MITVECGLPISAACTADIIIADIIRNVVSSSDDDIMVVTIMSLHTDYFSSGDRHFILVP